MEHKEWSKDEDDILLNHYESSPKDKILSLLPLRTWNAIQLRGKRIHGLNRESFRRQYGNSHAKGKKYVYKPRPYMNKDNCSYISNRGYRYVKVKESNVCKNGWEIYRPEHILLIENKIGRRLSRTKNGKGEGVHHINGDKLDNRIENLVLYSCEQEHRYMHNSLCNIAFELVKNGLIEFDPVNKTYFKRNNE